MKISIILATVLLAACGGQSGSSITITPLNPDIPAPSPVVQPTSDDVAACARLGVLGCPEAWPANMSCVEALSRARTFNVSVPSACVAAAADVAAVRACGDVSTLTVECIIP